MRCIRITGELPPSVAVDVGRMTTDLAQYAFYPSPFE